MFEEEREIQELIDEQILEEWNEEQIRKAKSKTKEVKINE